MLKLAICITQEHDLRFVLVAAAICALACFATVKMLSHAASNSPQARWWRAGSGGVFGCGVWSTHYVAELGFQPGVVVAYGALSTAISLLIVTLGSISAFGVFQSSWRTHPARSAAAGAVLGTAIAGMHFMGMAGMRLPGVVSFDAVGVACSIGAGIAFSTAALTQARRLSSSMGRASVAACLLLAICLLHFVAMSAVTILPGLADGSYAGALPAGELAAGVGGASFLILAACLAVSAVDRAARVRESGRLRQLADASFEGILLHRDGIVLEANRAFCVLVGEPKLTEVRGQELARFFPADATIARGAASPGASLHSAETILRTVNGRELPVEVLSQPIEYEGWPAAVLAIRDLSGRREAEARVRHLAHHDAMTDLPNRALFRERLDEAAVTSETGAGCAVLYVDLDRFKPVNDTFGHPIGDKLLCAAGNRILGCVRETDMAARLGGDEFAILLTPLDNPDSPAAVAQRVLDALGEPFEIEGHRLLIGASIGIAAAPGDGICGEALLKSADLALYRAKSDGRNRFVFFEPAMDAWHQRRRVLEVDLRAALEEQQFELHYQPLVDLGRDRINGFEALLRWKHPDRGLVPPSEFIPISEEIGLIGDIGKWVLRRAAQDAASWPDAMTVSVNVSPAQFKRDTLVAEVAEALAASGLAPHRLELEITETVLLLNSAGTLAALHALRALGVRVAMDDFGTGYSSLSYLRRFPFDKIKIDQSFVRDLPGSSDSAAIVRAITGLGSSLGIRITAEGVETLDQLDQLRLEGCSEIQGYICSKPRPAAQVPALLSAWNSGLTTWLGADAREVAATGTGVTPTSRQSSAASGTQILVPSRPSTD